VDIRQLARDLEKRERYKRDNPLLFARLNRPEQKFMDAVTVKGELPRILIFVGANKIGKSCMGAMRGLSLALGEHPFLPENHPLKYTKDRIPTPNTGLVVGELLSQIVDKKLVPEYRKWIPKICQPEIKKNQQGVITRITLRKDLRGDPLGSIIHFRSYDSAAETFEGIDQHWIHWDEPPPKKHFEAAERGLMPFNGVSFMTFTSLKEPWVKKELADLSINYGGSNENIRIVEGGDIWENSIENGGFMTCEAIDHWIETSVSKENYSTRVLGLWLASGALIFQSFKDEYPCVCPTFEVPSHWTWWEAIDPHDGKDTIWIFGAVSPYEVTISGEVVNRVFITDYMRLPPAMTISEMAIEVKKRRLELGYESVYSIVLDGKYGRRRQKTLDENDLATWEEKLEDVNIGYIELADQSPGDVELGHKIIKEYLKPQFWKLEETEVPGVVFMERCRGQGGPIEAMMNYRQKKDSVDPVDDEFKDVCDTVRYLLRKQPTFVDRDRSGMSESYSPKSKWSGR